MQFCSNKQTADFTGVSDVLLSRGCYEHASGSMLVKDVSRPGLQVFAGIREFLRLEHQCGAGSGQLARLPRRADLRHCYRHHHISIAQRAQQILPATLFQLLAQSDQMLHSLPTPRSLNIMTAHSVYYAGTV